MNNLIKFLIFALISAIVISFSSCNKDEDNSNPSELIQISIKDTFLKTDYYIGENLDLSGLIVTFIWDDGNEEDIAYSSFYANGLTCFPENGTFLTTEYTEIIVNHAETSLSAKQAISFKTLTDIDNNTYKIAKYGNQIWMLENLKTTQYSDGTEIYLCTDDSEWNNLSSSAYCWYNNDIETYKSSYGAIYNWKVVSTNKLCPSGWHVPSDTEWTTLANFKTETIETGFTDYSAGFRYKEGTFDFIDNSNCWSSTEYDVNMAYMRLWSYGKILQQAHTFKNSGISVRCVKD